MSGSKTKNNLKTFESYSIERLGLIVPSSSRKNGITLFLFNNFQMEELIKVTKNESGIQVVSARELHQFLEVSERFSSWFERQLQFGFLDGIDFTSVKSLTLVNNGAERELQDYALTLECAKSIGMVQRSEKGTNIRNYFIECEKKVNQFIIPKTRRELAEENLQLIIEIENKDALIALQTPKVKAFENVINYAATFTMDSLSDTVDIGCTKLFELLRSWNWITKKDPNGTASTRYCEENRYGKTIFESIVVNGKTISKKRFVLSRKGFELAIEKITKQND